MSRRGENIYKRKDGRWEGRYIKYRDSSGKAVYGYIYSRSYSETKIRLTQAKNSCNIQLLTEHTDVKFSEFALTWLEKTKNHCKQSTYVKYRNTLVKHILPELGNYRLYQLNTKIINAFCNDKLQHCKLSPKTVKDMLSIVKLIVNYASEFDVSCHCDFRNVSVKIKKEPISGLTSFQAKKIIDYLINNINNVNLGILVSFFTGIRIGELCALKFEDISFDSNTMHINKTMQRVQNFRGNENKTEILISSPKSLCSNREIPFPKFIADIIFKNNLYKENAYFLTGDRNKYIEPRTMENKFNKIAKICQIENVTFHMIRHTFASSCIEAGVDVKSLSEILGHSSVNITLNRYVHSSMQTKKNNMEKLYHYNCFSPSINQSIFL